MSNLPTPPRRPATTSDEQADALQDEFPEFQVWWDFRPLEDGTKHLHARQPDWTADMIISAYDAQGMRDELIIWRREQVTSRPAPDPDCPACFGTGQVHAGRSEPEPCELCSGSTS